MTTPFPSSHASPASRCPSPHTVQLSRHSWPLPPPGEPAGSQVSPCVVSTMLSPQRGMVQLLRQSSVSTPLPSSHGSPAYRCPSPHTVQLSRHSWPLPPAGEPAGSQVSPGGVSTMLSPQRGLVQLLRQSSVSTPFPSSHVSPASRCPSPHTVQLSRHSWPLPPAGEPAGSQVSPCVVSTMLSPQLGMVQLLRQSSVSTPFPSSHVSPASRCPSPHTVQLSRHSWPLPPAGEPAGAQVSPGAITTR